MNAVRKGVNPLVNPADLKAVSNDFNPVDKAAA